VVSPEGVSPFWEALGRHFFRMDFNEADRLSATGDSQFILDLMPQHRIYVDLLPESARAVVGQCHVDGAGARRLLEWEGFSFSSVVDIFDAGPLVSAPRDRIRTLREARRKRVKIEPTPGGGAKRGLIATAHIAGYRCVAARVSVEGDVATLDAAAAAALKLEAGAEVLVWTENDAS
jgi:arginine N-succinyltransferase